MGGGPRLRQADRAKNRPANNHCRQLAAAQLFANAMSMRKLEIRKLFDKLLAEKNSDVQRFISQSSAGARKTCEADARKSCNEVGLTHRLAVHPPCPQRAVAATLV